MPSTIEILGWTAKGLRCPDHEIDCVDSNDSARAITLVQMPNGTGKTTTLNLLRAALSGRWAKGGVDPAEIRTFQKKGSVDGQGLFEVRVRLDSQRVTLQLAFDFGAGRVRYRTTRQSGMEEGFHPPVEFTRFLNENFINFFVFDGELANHLLSDKHSDAEAVVETLFQLKTLDRMSSKVEAYWQARAEADANDGLERSRAKKLDRAKARLNHLKARQKTLRAEERVLKDRLTAQETAYQAELNKSAEVAKKIDEARTKKGDAADALRADALDALDDMRDPHALAESFAHDIYELKENLDRAKLPGTAAREFFQDLAKDTHCVCGEEITPEISVRIKERATLYLGSDEVGFLNAMKTDIEEVVGQSRSAPAKALDKRIDELETLARKSRDAHAEFDVLSEAAANADPAIARADEEIKGLKSSIADIRSELDRFDSKDTSQTIELTFGIDVMQKRVDDYDKKLATTQASLKLLQKRNILTRILKSAHVLARDGVTGELCIDANKRLSELMPDNDIVIEGIDRCLVLREQEGGSVGETLSVAYGFLATLFDRADHRLPFVVDSPAGPIDLAIRPKIGALIPKLTEQFIAFTISSERAQFVPDLKAASPNPIQFLTVFRKGNAALESQARATGQLSETADGCVVADEKFFSQFQLEKEDEAA